MDGAKALFSSRFAGSVGYYAAMLYYGKVAIDHTERYNKKNKSLHRMDIVGTNGCQMLSASLVKPNSTMSVGDVSLSEHGNWRHNHWGALFSAYGRTPYFDYFADELHSIYFDLSITGIAAFNEHLHRAVIDFLELPIETYYLTEKTPQNALNPVISQKSDLIDNQIAIAGIDTGDSSGSSADTDRRCSILNSSDCVDMYDGSHSRIDFKGDSCGSVGGSIDNRNSSLVGNGCIDRSDGSSAGSDLISAGSIESCIDLRSGSLIGSDCVDLRDGSYSWNDFKGGYSEYYQIWQSKFGFTLNLSILDLLFNQGKEAIFTLLSR